MLTSALGEDKANGLIDRILLGGCDYSPKLNFKYGKDLSDKIMGRTFKLKNTDGETVTLSSFRGLMQVVFFGFTQCPAVCPTTLARAAQAKKLMGRDGEIMQVSPGHGMTTAEREHHDP